MLNVLRRRDFALLWLGGLVSVAGDWVLYAAFPFYVYERTGSTIATAGMIVAELAPSFVLGSVAGVFVDRWDRRRVLVVANLAQGAAVALLLVVARGGPLWIVFAVAAVQAAAAAFAIPAESSLLPSLVSDDNLVPANALNALNNRLGRLIGLPVGAALYGALGLEGVVFVDAGSFVVAAVLVAAVSTSPRPAARQADALSAWAAFWAEWVDGLRVVRRERAVAVLFLVFGLMTFGGTMLDPLNPAWVRDVLHRGADVFALLLVVHAASGIAGTLLVGWFGRTLSPRALIGWSSLVAATATGIKYNVPSVPLAVSMGLVTGVTSVASSVGVETQAQRSVADTHRGRVFGSLNATLGLLSLAGALVGGALAEAVGIVPALNVCVGLIALAGIVALRAFREREPDEGAACARRRPSGVVV